MTAAHFLAITEESYDVSTVHGVYESLGDARSDIDRRMLSPNWYCSYVQVQEWSGGKRRPKVWERWRASIRWEELG